MVEEFQNNYTTQLDGAIDDNDTTITVVDAPGMFGDFRIRIDDEIIFVGTVNGLDLEDCIRGVEGTVAASHANGVDVKHVLTANALLRATYGTYGGDIADDATLTASNSEGGFPASNMADGNNSTYWSSGTNAHPLWVKADFGAGLDKAIRKMVVYSLRTAGWARPNGGFIQYSDDNSVWRTALYIPAPANVSDAAYGGWQETASYRWDDVGAHRYWRFYITQSHDPAGTTNWTRIHRWELRQEDY